MKNGLLDFLQSASNAVAGNVAGPVDLLGMGLKKIGIPVREPVGGSEWMKRKGLMRDVQQGPARVLGETAGLLGPAMVTQFAPQIAKGLLQGADNLAAPATMNKQTGAIVWHGSPHKFDKFDSSKIGTGEGAQAYGHGLYLAESPDVAGQYQKTLAADGFLVGDKVFDPSSLQHMNVRSVARKGDVDAAIAKAQELASSGSPVASMAAQDLARLREIKAAGGMQQNTGSLYKVDLPDEHIAKMLDWDKPLSQQAPEVQSALQNSGLTKYADDYFKANRKAAPTGADLHDFLKYSGYDQGELAAKMAEQGLPGIRYLDGGSRGAGSGTSNFVVFPGNEGLLSILERNGVPLK